MNRPSLEQRAAVRVEPDRLPIMYQQWRDLLFLHWEMDATTIQATLPNGLFVDTYEEQAFLTVTPLFMRNVRPVSVPAVPGISNFLELNVRTYVHDRLGRPGVWFYSLDCNQFLAVKAARGFFHLNYEDAKMAGGLREDGGIEFSCLRKGTTEPGTYFWKTTGDPYFAESGSLEYFLIERYLLFAAAGEQLYLGRIHHQPYPVRKVETFTADQVMLRLNGFQPRGEVALAQASDGVDVKVYALEKVDAL
ncbi:MAG: DUF2071 domain-containing protein [Verrucomicrobiota bacterium]|nr:DUF2071 domain-containing protein [Verrucomicrobiota bacterium]